MVAERESDLQTEDWESLQVPDHHTSNGGTSRPRPLNANQAFFQSDQQQQRLAQSNTWKEA